MAVETPVTSLTSFTPATPRRGVRAGATVPVTQMGKPRKETLSPGCQSPNWGCVHPIATTVHSPQRPRRGPQPAGGVKGRGRFPECRPAGRPSKAAMQSGSSLGPCALTASDNCPLGLPASGCQISEQNSSSNKRPVSWGGLQSPLREASPRRLLGHASPRGPPRWTGQCTDYTQEQGPQLPAPAATAATAFGMLNAAWAGLGKHISSTASVSGARFCCLRSEDRRGCRTAYVTRLPCQPRRLCVCSQQYFSC